MIENTKCECGHQNPVDTVLCEACGKPLVEIADKELLEMRYDGVARRSQRKKPNLLDRIWGFFSSVKVAVYLIIITLCVATLGTLYPQENTFIGLDPAQYYEENHGTLGKIYYMLGFSRTYESWWFIGLLFLLGTSLVVCSLDRVIPLYRALKRQQVRKHTQFLERQKVVYKDKLFDAHDEKVKEREMEWLEQFANILRKKFYKVQVENSALMAEKYRFSRWGPYVIHIGLIIFLVAALLRTVIPGWYMDEYISIMEGDIKQIPGTNYYLKNEKFTVEFYEQDELSPAQREEGRIIPKLFETRAVLYECVRHCDDESLEEPVLIERLRHDIRVNEPLEYDGIMAYQFDYEFTPQLRSIRVELKDHTTGESFGFFDLETDNPAESYTVGPYELTLIHYYPDFGYENGKPVTKSSKPNAPAYVFSITGPGVEDGAVHMYFPRPEDKVRFAQDRINEAAGSPFLIEAAGMEDVEFALYTTFLNIRVDKGMPLVWVGAVIGMIGLVMGTYWQHRRIWVRFDEGQLLLGAHTNKNWYGLRQEIAKALAGLDIRIDPKSLINEVKRS